MNLTQIAGVLLAVLVVATGAAAALPGNAPTDSQAGQADEYSEETDAAQEADASNETAAENATDDEADANPRVDEDRRGPPSDMPAAVPDFVSQLHDLIQEKIDGSMANLGQQISDLTPGDGSPAEQSSDAGSMAPSNAGQAGNR